MSTLTVLSLSLSGVCVMFYVVYRAIDRLAKSVAVSNDVLQSWCGIVEGMARALNEIKADLIELKKDLEINSNYQCVDKSAMEKHTSKVVGMDLSISKPKPKSTKKD